MLFNSYVFIFGFLPVALLGYEVAGRFHRRAVVAWLTFASLAFYAYWKPAFLLVLVASISLNYLFSSLICRQIPNAVSSKKWLQIAICANLGALCYFKYLFPSLNFLGHATGHAYSWTNVALPLGISFFTFTQIAFLVDLHQGVAKHRDVLSYALFVTFFPHLIAGPILHHKEMMPQFQQERRYRLDLQDVVVGFSWFAMGLTKKVLLADALARYTDPIFQYPNALPAALAWRGALSYVLQLYFDFSGYSDMALGLARMFSIDFPLNFNSPFKARNIVDFWQRWHITLSQYITAYLYSPLEFWVRRKRREAGKPVNRASFATAGGFGSMVAFPMLFSMLIAGIWHGAGLTFVLYGVIHGIYLTINHAWRIKFPPGRVAAVQPTPATRRLKHIASVLLTFACVVVSLVVFRADTVKRAFVLVANMLGMSGFAPYGPPGGAPQAKLAIAYILLGLFIVWFLPNTQEILRDYKPSLQGEMFEGQEHRQRLLWKPTLTWACVLGVAFFFSLVSLQNPSSFLYFQF
jgi:D-alanyl-lipoteichoic acid acyltransferase DltB (MBOAT superfamily)